MVQLVSDNTETEGTAEVPDRLDRTHIVVNVITLDAFLAALRQETAPNERLSTVIGTAPPWSL